MSRFRMLGMILASTGMLLIGTGVAIPLSGAVECDNDIPQEDLTCDSAHAVFKHVSADVKMGCEGDAEDCGPKEGSKCGTFEGYQVAIRGRCVTDLSASTPTRCFEDAASTFIPLDYYTSECKFHQQSCRCVLVKSMQHPTQYSEVCDCYGI